MYAYYRFYPTVTLCDFFIYILDPLTLSIRISVWEVYMDARLPDLVEGIASFLLEI
jgi:hypothetical protein